MKARRTLHVLAGSWGLCYGIALVLLTGGVALSSRAAEEVPSVVLMPGTQPGEVSAPESPNRCDNCHGGYDASVEPAHTWRGNMMANAGRDPLFWATLAIAEQDFDGSGDLCLRCHSTTGWIAGRSTPTDGSGLAASDSDGVDCDFCHKMTNPDDSEHQGVMNAPYVANQPGDDSYDWDDPNGIEAYLGSGMVSLWAGSDKLGPYDNADARHQFMLSLFHRDRDFCGSCHDVSNPVVGELAPNHGTLAAATGTVQTGSGAAGDTVAFNNPPYRYGIVERTFSEYKSALIARTRVDDFPALPDLLRGGALQAIWESATVEGARSADYQNPSAPRYYSCQTCHMQPVEGYGANKSGVPLRTDLPLHDLTGGNYWMAEVIEYLDALGRLRLGGGLSAVQHAALEDGAQRARNQLMLAASLEVDEQTDTVTIVNHTGHKLISGYPEGRRMWLNVRWLDASGSVLREDGAYGEIRDSLGQPVLVDGVPVRSLLDPEDPNTRVYEAHMGMTREWIEALAGLLDPDLVLAFDRTRTSPTDSGHYTLGEFLAGQEQAIATFHFVLNNAVIKDSRIPPYGMAYDLAADRNVLPVPASQFGDPGTGGTYDFFDIVPLNPPAAAVSADIRLMYQPTSWEYIQFLWLANEKTNAFLANEGEFLLDAWLHAGADDGLAMAEPLVMAQAQWHDAPSSCSGASVVIQNRLFEGTEDCVATIDLTANTNVRVSAGAIVRFISPSTTLGPGFSVMAGASFSVLTSNPG